MFLLFTSQEDISACCDLIGSATHYVVAVRLEETKSHKCRCRGGAFAWSLFFKSTSAELWHVSIIMEPLTGRTCQRQGSLFNIICVCLILQQEKKPKQTATDTVFSLILIAPAEKGLYPALKCYQCLCPKFLFISGLIVQVHFFRQGPVLMSQASYSSSQSHTGWTNWYTSLWDTSGLRMMPFL